MVPYWFTTIQISWLTPYASKAEDFWIWKFRGWAVKTLSYAGRLLLISRVISGTVNFWCSTFMLPKGCVKKIVSLCSRFLWSGQIEIAKGAKVNWNKVCLPKPEGGLGLRKYRVWDKVLCLRFIWLLFANSDSLWAAWHNHHHLQQKKLMVSHTNQQRLLDLDNIA